MIFPKLKKATHGVGIHRSKSRNSKWYPCRCSKCGTRKTLHKHPDDHIIPSTCPKCRNRKWTLSKWSMTRGRKQRCNCTLIKFPHRKGSKYCEAHPDCQKDWEELYARTGRYAS